jgi:hypothetical protein
MMLLSFVSQNFEVTQDALWKKSAVLGFQKGK